MTVRKTRHEWYVDNKILRQQVRSLRADLARVTAERDARPAISREDAATALTASGQFSDPDSVMDEWAPILDALRAHTAGSGNGGDDG